eukprot:4749656-Pleurochrysis_carterae.AAC.3
MRRVQSQWLGVHRTHLAARGQLSPPPPPTSAKAWGIEKTGGVAKPIARSASRRSADIKDT